MKKKMSKKGAMELSMNTIIIVVIGITLLVLGLVFVRGIFTKLGELGGGAFEKAETELGKIETGDTKINFPTNIEVKKGKASNPTLRVCNTDNTLKSPKIELKAYDFPSNKGLSVRIGSTIVDTKDQTGKIENFGEIENLMCRPFPTLVSVKSDAKVDTQPYLEITVYTGNNIYDSIGTIITII